MAAAAMMDREPEVARFIDSYKYDQDVATRRDRYGGGTSLPLNSDGYEEKQQRLREERRKDWLVQQDKPKDPVYYRVGTPEEGFPGLGEYEKQRKDNNMRRQKEYNDLMKKQRQMEQQKYEARRHTHQQPAQPPGPQMDYNLASEQARAEEKRAYQDYMGKYLYSINSPHKPVMDYERNKRFLNEERRREYNELLEKKAKEERYWAMRGRPRTPPGGLNLGQYDRQVKETAQQKKKEYKEMLDQQQREHMFIRARQEPEMAVLDRNAQPQQYLANKPPAGPAYGRGRDEAEEKRRHDEVRHQQQMGKPAEVVKNPYYSSDDYEKFQKEIQRKQGEEYRDFLAKQFEPGQDAQGLPLGQYRYEPQRLALEAQRNKEYNELLKKQKYTNPGRRHDFVDTASGPYGGLFSGLGEHGNRSDVLNKERQQEYNDRLDQKFGKDRPSGRPNWVQESLPNNTDRGRSPQKIQPPQDQYQQILDEKRREEANRRRYEDPEYQDRLAHGRDRGEAGQRYGY